MLIIMRGKIGSCPQIHDNNIRQGQKSGIGGKIGTDIKYVQADRKSWSSPALGSLYCLRWKRLGYLSGVVCLFFFSNFGLIDGKIIEHTVSS